MKIKSFYLAVIYIISFLFIQSCNTNEIKDSNNSTSSNIQLKLVDGPDDTYLEVWVDIIDVQYNRNDDEFGWTSFDGFPAEEGSIVIDLLTLTAGSSHILTDQEIESGMLSKVRLVLGGNNSIVIEGLEEPIPLKTPSAQQSGLKLHLDTELVAGYSYTFILDWDVQKSIIKAGNSGIYNLKPVIRVVAEANSGTILGRIADIEETEENAMPLEALVTVYDASDDTFANPGPSTTSNNEGLFMIQGIPEGSYVLRIEKEIYDISDSDIITVVNGQDSDVGTFFLTKSTGGIIGRVKDLTETDTEAKPITGATVAVYSVIDSVETFIINTTTDDNGDFNILDLLPGDYILKVTMEGYDEISSGTILVEVNMDTSAGTILMTLSPV